MAGELGYGERGMVESTAMSPMAAGQTGGPQGMMGGPQGPPNLGMAVEPFAPTSNPQQAITAGLEPDAMMSPDPADVLRAMYRKFPYPDLRRLLERAQSTDYNAMARQDAPAQMGGKMGGMQPPMGGGMGGMMGGGMESMMDPAQMAEQINQGGMTRGQTADAARLQGQADRMLGEGADPDQSSVMTTDEAENRLGAIRDERTGGRFEQDVNDAAVVDRIVDGNKAAILVGDDETELIVDAELMPEEIAEGDVVRMEFFFDDELTEARRAQPNAMPDRAEATNAAVLDRIVDGRFATLIVGPDEIEITVDLALMPDGAEEGDWFQIGFNVDANETGRRRGEAERGMDEIRGSRQGGRFNR
jgi:hypothetical protein